MTKDTTVKLIIDSDPGVDDVTAFLLALNTPNVDLKLISLVFGNCDTVNSLRNTVSMFHVLRHEREHRERTGKPVPWAGQKPIVSVGMSTALNGDQLDATDFHGADGLGNVHELAPHFTADNKYISLFRRADETDPVRVDVPDLGFIASRQPSYLDILEVLREEEPNTVTIAAIGPLQNIAMAAQTEPETFARVKQVLVMGGALFEAGNCTPTAEFNVYADPTASARIYALTCPQPKYTLPPGSPEVLYNFAKPLDLTLFPLDVTHKVWLAQEDFDTALAASSDSPLAQWMCVWLKKAFANNVAFAGLPLLNPHDALTVWYAFGSESKGWTVSRGNDIRVETAGHLTKGTTIIDRRGRPKSELPTHNDHDNWLLKGAGNSVSHVEEAPHMGADFGKFLLKTILL
ncbi:hypothetical protein TRVA0_018S00474 [Trichomonascus vanleenenianus]|uniref:uncharacterized protein n=1 Tax=Trichomonascus vanleenenianus TaxID=2268995 RepID=UPI003ECB17A8